MTLPLLNILSFLLPYITTDDVTIIKYLVVSPTLYYYKSLPLLNILSFLLPYITTDDFTIIKYLVVSPTLYYYRWLYHY